MISFDNMIKYLEDQCNIIGDCADCPLNDICIPYFSRFSVESTDVPRAYERMKGYARVNNNPYWNNICTLANKQRLKGIKTYGQGLEDNKKPTKEKIQYIEEELIDALMYLEWLKDGVQDGE